VTLINSNVYQNEASCCDHQRGVANIENNGLLSITSSHVGAGMELFAGSTLTNTNVYSSTARYVRSPFALAQTVPPLP